METYFVIWNNSISNNWSGGMKPFDYYQPSTLAEAIQLLAHYGEQARILAGGTALLLDMQHGEIAPTHLISLDHVPNLNTFHETGGWHIGALTTISDLASFAENYPPLRALVDSGWL